MVIEWNANPKWIELTKKVVGDIENPREICVICGSRAQVLHHPLNHNEYSNEDDYLNEISLTPLCVRCHFVLHSYPDSFKSFSKSFEIIEETNISPKVPESCNYCRYSVFEEINGKIRKKCLKHKAKVNLKGEQWLCHSYKRELKKKIEKAGQKKEQKIKDIKNNNIQIEKFSKCVNCGKQFPEISKKPYCDDCDKKIDDLQRLKEFYCRTCENQWESPSSRITECPRCGSSNIK